MTKKTSHPADIETRMSRIWEESGAFKAGRPERRDAAPFTIVIPPPNVTGSLHMGHALNNTLQDILCRFERMRGRDVLWQPGTDHAGIATQMVVERQLMERQLPDRRAMGREAFVKRVWEWKEESGGTILRQLKRLGASCDWSRERFTMDEGLSRAVREAFVRLWEEGLIYRDDYIVNWCPRCQTVLSDLEVEREERDAEFVYIKYGPLTLGTVRPETKLGDTGLAVHPKDRRYAQYVGKTLEVPSVDGTVSIRVVADEAVDPKFGTGVIKVTPGHDPVDFEIGKRHGLPIRTVIGFDGRMTAAAGRYAGLDRFECRKRIVDDMKALGLVERIEPYRHTVGVCYRCKTVVEPELRRARAPGSRRARHVVLLGPVALLDDGMAGRHAGAARVLPDLGARHRIRHPLLLGRPHGHAGPAFHAGGALPRRLHPRPRPRRRRPEDVEVEGQRRRSAGGDGQVRHGRLPVHAGGARRPRARCPDQRRADRGVPELHEQALERRTAGAVEPRRIRCGEGPEGGAGPRRSLDPEPARRDGRHGPHRAPALSVQRRRVGRVPVPVARVLRLVPRDREALPLSRRASRRAPAHPAHAGRGARDDAAPPAPVHAVHHGGGLAAAAAQGRVDHDRALPEGREEAARPDRGARDGRRHGRRDRGPQHPRGDADRRRRDPHRHAASSARRRGALHHHRPAGRDPGARAPPGRPAREPTAELGPRRCGGPGGA